MPAAVALAGVLMIGASFLPVGNWAAQSQWTPEDSAAYDRVSNEYKRTAYESPARMGLSPEEYETQRAKMKEQMLALQGRLERAKSQPKRWRYILLGIGVLLTAAGFYGSAVRAS